MSGFSVYKLIIRMEDSDKNTVSESARMVITPICEDCRPEAKALFSELPFDCITRHTCHVALAAQHACTQEDRQGG